MEPIGKNLAAALVKAQAGFAPALKTRDNPAFRSRYADLATCVDAVIDPDKAYWEAIRAAWDDFWPTLAARDAAELEPIDP